MKRTPAAMLLIGLCLAGGLEAGDNYLDARRLVREGKILSLEKILAGIRQVRPGQILEVEIDDDDHRMIYEIEILDTRGSVWELKVDAVTGEILEQELGD